MSFKESEKFWAFIFLIVAVCGLVLLASSFGRDASATDLVMQAKLRIIDAAITGILTIAGMAAQALFRISSTDQKNAESLMKLADNAAPTEEPRKVEVVNDADKPVPTTDTASEEALPEYAKP